jgi:hypothetical protein
MINWKSLWTSMWQNFAYDTAKRIVSFLAGGAVIATVTYIVHKVLPQHDILAASIVLCIAVGVMVWSTTRRTERPKQGIQQVHSTLPAPSVAITTRDIDEFYHTYDLNFIEEVEHLIGVQVNAVAPEERERFLTRFLVSGLIGYMFEATWYTIFRSQIDALHHLVGHSLKREQLKVYYDHAAAASPSLYQSYTFEQWVGYMRSQVLIREDGDWINITIRGREFLKYLINSARSSSSRAY